MNWTGIKAGLSVAKATVVKHSPEILMGLGAVSFIGTVIAASRETVKQQIINEAHHDVLDEFALANQTGELDDKAYRKSKRNEYRALIKLTTKNYIPAVALGVTSLTCFFGAFGIMKKRYTTLVVAYTALEESFRAYRQRVIDDKGEEADLYYLTGAKTKEITTKDEDGKKTKTKQLILPDGSIASPYAFKFGKYKENGEINQQWINDAGLLMAYTLGQQDWANDQLWSRTVFTDDRRVKYRGWWFLNETRELLGEDATTAASVAGNRISNGEPGCNGYIDFRIIEATEIDPDNGGEIPCLFINPNVDGLIYDLVGQKEKEPFHLNYDLYGEDVTV